MKKPATPTDEVRRLQELYSLVLLDTDAEKDFDEIVALASYITGCPISLISLIDTNRQWFKARVGLDATETPRDISFCGHAILEDQLLEVENAVEDERFRDNPLVTGDPSIRFYAGQPLITEGGFRIGTLCAIDRVPKSLNDEQRRHMGALATQVIKLIELRALNRRQKLDALTQAEFLANVSHEIRTPLTGILGYASVAHETLLEEQPSSAALPFLDHIDRHSKHILSILGNVLDLSKVESGKIELDPSTFRAADLKDHAVSLFGLEARKKHVSLQIEVSDNVPQFISADATKLKQILTNLVGNALKFTSQGHVSVQIDLDAVEKMLHLTIEDSGLGMTEEQSARLFNAFVQADSTIGSKYGGSGLGLALSRKMSEAMGGHLILAESTLNKGSTFVAAVKVEPVLNWKPDGGYSGRDAIRNTLTSAGAHASILVTDDSEDTRFIFKHYLKQYSMHADEASDGASTMALVAAKKYDVIFLDLQMPDENGFEVIKKIRAVRPRAKVIAFTAYTSPEHQEEFREAGFDGFLAKPIDQKELSNVLFESFVL